MIKKNTIIISFFICNTLSTLKDTYKIWFLLINIFLLLFQVFNYYKNIKSDLFDENIKLNKILVIKTLFLVLFFTAVIGGLKLLNHHDNNLLTYVFNTKYYLINYLNDFFIKPSIVFMYVFNFNNKLNVTQTILIALTFSFILNAHMLFDFNFLRFSIFENWVLYFIALLYANTYFYNRTFVWIWALLINLFLTNI